MSVFSTANQMNSEALYEILLCSSEGESVECSAGIAFNTTAIDEINPSQTDTVIVVGGNAGAVNLASSEQTLLNWICLAEKSVERYAAICTGAFTLAASGVLNGKRATTHWRACKALTKQFPLVEVDVHAVYVISDRAWTSAGVTCGIDMSLEMVKQDHGTKLKGDIAKMLVVYSHRPGYQSQFSSILKAQNANLGEFEDLIQWLHTNTDRKIKVQEMADFSGMSLRNFHRKFSQAIGVSPAKYIECVRIDRAKDLLESGRKPKAVMAALGFRSEAAFSQAFRNEYGISPSAHQSLHNNT